jgi:light-regulated signal transduction histidine kinase (bacteriophytochrome)
LGWRWMAGMRRRLARKQAGRETFGHARVAELRSPVRLSAGLAHSMEEDRAAGDGEGMRSAARALCNLAGRMDALIDPLSSVVAVDRQTVDDLDQNDAVRSAIGNLMLGMGAAGAQVQVAVRRNGPQTVKPFQT